MCIRDSIHSRMDGPEYRMPPAPFFNEGGGTMIRHNVEYKWKFCDGCSLVANFFMFLGPWMTVANYDTSILSQLRCAYPAFSIAWTRAASDTLAMATFRCCGSIAAVVTLWTAAVPDHCTLTNSTVPQEHDYLRSQQPYIDHDHRMVLMWYIYLLCYLHY